MTWEEWKAQAQKVVDAWEIGAGDLWEEDDPYDLLETAREDFEGGMSPEASMESLFGEDLARKQLDDSQAAQSFEEGRVEG